MYARKRKYMWIIFERVVSGKLCLPVVTRRAGKIARQPIWLVTWPWRPVAAMLSDAGVLFLRHGLGRAEEQPPLLLHCSQSGRVGSVSGEKNGTRLRGSAVAQVGMPIGGHFLMRRRRSRFHSEFEPCTMQLEMLTSVLVALLLFSSISRPPLFYCWSNEWNIASDVFLAFPCRDLSTPCHVFSWCFFGRLIFLLQSARLQYVSFFFLNCVTLHGRSSESVHFKISTTIRIDQMTHRGTARELRVTFIWEHRLYAAEWKQHKKTIS